MKSLLLTTFVVALATICTFGQKLNSQNSFSKAAELASKKNVPILLIVTVPNIQRPVTVQGVKIDFSTALDDKEVIEKINENFIVYKTVISDTSVRSVLSRSSVNTFPAYVFLHPNKDVFYKDFGNFGNKERYFSMIKMALSAEKEKSLSELERDYLANEKDYVLLKQLIDTRKKAGINTNADLIEQYINSLKPSDFNNYESVLYILEAGPYINGNAYKIAFTNRKITDSIYKTEPLQKRLAFNNQMINNTITEAIKKKNIAMAYSVANFTRGTWNSDFTRGGKAYDSQMMRYYLGIKDTANYMRTAMFHYDRYYMKIGADSIKKIEAKDREASIQRNMPTMISKANMLSKEKMDSLMKLPGSAKITQSLTAVGSTSTSFAMELNNAAWQYYLTGTDNINYLTKAMIWSRRSIELNPLSGYYDTLAHILYRMKFFEEAIKTEEDAIKKSKTEGRTTDALEVELKKMKARKI